MSKQLSCYKRTGLAGGDALNGARLVFAKQEHILRINSTSLDDPPPRSLIRRLGKAQLRKLLALRPIHAINICRCWKILQ